MNEMMNEMNVDEIKSIFTKGLFNKMNKMIEEKKLSIENTILLLKHVGFCKALKNLHDYRFRYSSLNKRMEEMIIEEEEKKEEKNERLLVDLCECYISLSYNFPPKLLSICVTCLLKAALNKEESEENQKEVEIALLALSNTEYNEIDKELYLKEITEIIKYQQKHRNLTKLAYQSAWQFLIYRFFNDDSLEEVIVNELHFGREAARELEELARCIDWKKKGGVEMNKEETKDELILMRWLCPFFDFFRSCRSWNEEFVELISSITKVFRAAKNNFCHIRDQCIHTFLNAVENMAVKIEDLLKSGAVDAVLEEVHQSTLNEDTAYECLLFFLNISERMKEEEDDEKEEMKRRSIKMEIFEKMEEEGYEDAITSFHETTDFLNKKCYYQLSLNISDYFVNA
eukprot:MONOS_13224.1-p1 / transcript=MONOS_13224.1 / gene=MONOS_13224 / organism=Monocercomonoides_exilis_PA203 / gene_product=unspecified product / transcript_product=unspecified product / location=Mono_scaffold00794:1054-2307(+) / protein_length=400 / sequence_SO=supercontig / SO=protein_coding / is_pseudo=false